LIFFLLLFVMHTCPLGLMRGQLHWWGFMSHVLDVLLL